MKVLRAHPPTTAWEPTEAGGTKTGGSTTAGLDDLESAEIPFSPESLTLAQDVGIGEDITETVAAPEGGWPASTYHVGVPGRPALRHDNGHLQNPADPRDPKPIDVVEPTTSDYVALAKWRAVLEGAVLIRPDLSDANAAYRHFLEGDGADREIAYDRFIRNDPAGAVVLDAMTRDAQLGAQQIYSEMIANDPQLASRPMTFQMSGSPRVVGGSDELPYPATENWQKALGGHTLWSSAVVTVVPRAGGPEFAMGLTLHAEDRYNFNPTDADIATDIPDSANGRFERTGLGVQYTNRGEASRVVAWTEGSIEPGTSTRVGASRERGPKNARFLGSL